MKRVREYLCSRKRVVSEAETDGYQLISASCYGLRRFDGSPLPGCAREFATLIRPAETLIIHKFRDSREEIAGEFVVNDRGIVLPN